jgi:hypothetical protein
MVRLGGAAQPGDPVIALGRGTTPGDERPGVSIHGAGVTVLRGQPKERQRRFRIGAHPRIAVEQQRAERRLGVDIALAGRGAEQRQPLGRLVGVARAVGQPAAERSIAP